MAKTSNTSKAVAAKGERARLLKAAANQRTQEHVNGFVNFIREQGVIGLAIGLVLGVQVKAVVDQLVASFIDPLLGLVMPGRGGLDVKSFSLSLGEKTATFSYGAFISVLLSFVVVAAVVYITFKLLGLDKLDKKKS